MINILKNKPHSINVYKKHGFTRSICRLFGRIIYGRYIKSANNTKILVCLHLYYDESFIEIKEFLKNLSPYKYDLCVTYTPENISQSTLKEIKKFRKDSTLLPCTNSGFDIGPYIEAIRLCKADTYDIVFKLHSKGTSRPKTYIYDRIFVKRDWFLYLFHGILGPLNVHKVIHTLSTDSAYGMAAASNLIVNDPLHKQKLLFNHLEKLNYPIPSTEYKYIAGTCFAVRGNLVRDILDLNLTIDDFAPSSRGVFSLAHAIERLFCIAAANHGYQIYGTKVLPLRQKWRNNDIDNYRSTSSLRLLDDDRFDLDSEFFYRTLENKQVESWEIVNIPLNKIKRKWHDGIYYSLNECSPYKYLDGNISAYEKYCEYHHQNNLPDMTRERFDTLIKSIDKNGFNSRNIIVVNHSNILLDGQHRACCLMHRYGDDYRADVLRITITNHMDLLQNQRKARITHYIKYLIAGFTLFGSSLSMVISYTAWKSVFLAILHGALGWLYVLFRIII